MMVEADRKIFYVAFHKDKEWWNDSKIKPDETSLVRSSRSCSSSIKCKIRFAGTRLW